MFCPQDVNTAAAWGVSEEEYPDVPLWLENVRSVNFFMSIANQWRVGGAGAWAYALDYNVLFHELDRLTLEKDEYDKLLEDVRVMEAAALAEIAKRNDAG